MKIRVGRKYLDDRNSYPRFELQVVSVIRGTVRYRARLCDKTVNESEWHDYIYKEKYESFIEYKPMFQEVKPTRLARKMYPDAKEEDGMLILEDV